MSKYSYLPADESFVINDGDPSLTPIRISLPKPPPYEMIAGYGLPPEEQRFQRENIPQRLQVLWENSLFSVQEYSARSSRHSATLFRVQKEFWRRLRADRQRYDEEIKWLKRVWWHRVNGYWFFNNGKPTYICGWHYSYLNFWQYTENTRHGNKFPEYRDRDRRWYLFQWYIYKTRETFASYNEAGRPIKVNGKYPMVDLGRRVFYGTINTKQRRAGETHKSLSIGFEIVTMTEGGVGGIISYSGDNTEKHFRGKLVKAFQKYPPFLLPFYDGSYSPAERLEFRLPSSESGMGINSSIMMAKTGDGKAFEGERLVYLLADEEGKTDSIDVLQRWYQLAETMSTGNGYNIFGYALHPSTVEDMGNGDYLEKYRTLLEQSDFYERNPATGRTLSGLCRFFIPADDGAEGFIDSYGYSVKGKITEHQKKEGFTITATDYYKSERRHVLAVGGEGAMEKYKSLCRKFPLEYADSWISAHGGIGWNIIKIEKRIAELYQNPHLLPRRGRFVGNMETGYRFVDDPMGNWMVSLILPFGESNLYVRENAVDSLTGRDRVVYAPLKKNRFTLGVDPIKESGKKNKSKLSQAAAALFIHYNVTADGRGIDRQMLTSNRFGASYLARPNTTEEFYKEIIACMVYYGAMLYPEDNVTGLREYIENHGYGGYLKYDVDAFGRIKTRPGYYMTYGLKNDMYNEFRDYIELNVEREVHVEILEAARDIKNMDQLTDYDILAAALGAYHGAQSRINEVLSEDNVLDLKIFKNCF